MLGTAAADVGVWLLLEHRGPWKREIGDCELGDSVARRLDELQARHPTLRPMLIRRDGGSETLSLYVVTTGTFGAVYHFDLNDSAELLDIDVDAVIGGDVTTELDARPLYLVCTHGERDACCATYGRAFYKALVAQQPEAEVWQSSHQGGHRFAPAVLYLPWGVHYGRLQPGEAGELVAAHQRGDIFAMCRYRGQTAYPRPAQAAEAWLREQQDLLAIDGVELVDQETLAGGRYAIQFRTKNAMRHRLVVESQLDTLGRQLSCDSEVPESPTWYDVIRHEAHMGRPRR